MILVLAAVLAPRSAQAQAPAPAAAPPAPPATLWTFLGFPPPPSPEQKAQNTALCLGVQPSEDGYPLIKRTPMAKLFHGLLLKPLMTATGMMPGALPLEAPANLQSPNAAIKAAAQIKAEENLVPQKIAALRYVGKIGCDCYPGVTEALLAGLDDCNERVRLAAIRAIHKSKCCNPQIQERLSKIANETDDYGQFVEPSEKVRQAAAEAWCECPPMPAAPEPAPAPVPEGAPPEGAPAQAEREAANRLPLGIGHAVVGAIAGARRDRSAATLIGKAETRADIRRVNGQKESTQPTPTSSPRYAPRASQGPVIRGHVASVDQQSGVIYLHFEGQVAPPVGSQVTVSHRFLFGSHDLGALSVIEQRGEAAIAIPLGDLAFGKVSKGDAVVTTR